MNYNYETVVTPGNKVHALAIWADPAKSIVGDTYLRPLHDIFTTYLTTAQISEYYILRVKVLAWTNFKETILRKVSLLMMATQQIDYLKVLHTRQRNKSIVFV